MPAVDATGTPVWTQLNDTGYNERIVWDANKYYGDGYDVSFSPFGLLQWIWDGAGTVYKVNDTTPNRGDYQFLGDGQGRFNNRYDLYESTYLQPFTSPNLTSAVNWLFDRRLSVDYMLTYALPTLMADLEDL